MIIKFINGDLDLLTDTAVWNEINLVPLLQWLVLFWMRENLVDWAGSNYIEVIYYWLLSEGMNEKLFMLQQEQKAWRPFGWLNYFVRLFSMITRQWFENQG